MDPRPSTSTPSLTAAARLHAHGLQTLDDAELLATVLGGTKGTNSTQKAAHALLTASPLAELSWASPEQLEQIPGIGPTRAAAIAAAFELGRRVGWSPPRRGERCLSPARVYELLRNVAHADREEFHIVLLDVRARIIKSVRISQGSLTSCPVSPRDVLREAVVANAHSLILAHNHPSNDATPSPEDDELTERLRAACATAGVPVRDHVIVSATSYFSYVEKGRWHR